jgi:pimeloyl-ACP methyl ester carboxylesterase
MLLLRKVLIGAVVLIILVLAILLILREIKQKQISNLSEELISNGGISQVEEVEIGGTKLHILIEGAKPENPVCVFIHGGPGAPFPFGVSSRSLYPELTENCTVVFYDQRGAGKSFSKDTKLSTMKLEQFISDANEVVDYARNELNQDKVFLVGNSFGTIVGAHLANRYPEKLHGYIGVGQVTNTIENQKLAYDWLKAEAAGKDDNKSLKILDEIGEGPYYGEPEGKLGDLLNKYPGYNYSDENTERASMVEMVKGAFISPDYSLVDAYKALISGATFSLFESKDLQEEIINTNLFETVPDLNVPVYIIQGKQDKVANYKLAKDYFEMLKSPSTKRFITLENSAHYPNREDFKQLQVELGKIVNN